MRSDKTKARHLPKGRQAKAKDRAELKSLLGDKPSLERTSLLEHLHLIQDVHGHLPARLLVALAEEMNLPLSEVFETVRFYAHFDYVEDGEKPPPPVTVRVCTSLPCAMAGSARLAEELRAMAGPHVRIVEAPCMGGCDSAPFAMAGRNRKGGATAKALLDLVGEGRLNAVIPKYADFGAWMEQGGYRAFGRVRRGELAPEDVIALIERSGLRGLGGAGFPAHVKWRAVLDAEGVKYVVINADEGEPGTFKDRHVLERTPHAVLEGALIAAETLKAQGVYIYLRDEYPHVHSVLSREILLLEDLNIIPKKYVHLRRGAGAYICGEESALLESLEGKRGWPRQKPPYVSENGLFGQPTLVHNVETISRIPAILNGDGEAARKRLYSVSGRVRCPGVYEAPAGTTVRQLIEMAGGMAEGHVLRAFLPGGASGGILPASLADEPLDFGTLEKHGAFVGSGALIVLSDRDDLKEVARNLVAFFTDESCGQCTPCRQGCVTALQLLEEGRWERELLEDLGHVMREGSICGLGQAAPNAFLSILRHFPEELS